MTAASSGLETALVRLYRACLLLYPREFRAEYHRELSLVLRDRCREQSTRLGVLGVWIDAVLGVLVEAPREHWHVTVEDVGHAVRVLRRERTAALTTALVLGLGIGSATLVFSLINALLLRPLPYADVERLVALEEMRPGRDGRMGVAFPNYLDLRERSRSFEDVAVFSERNAPLRGEGVAEVIPVGLVSDGALGVLGIEPILGRSFTREDDLPGGPRVALLGEELWRRRYSASPDVIGRSIRLGSGERTVIGVLPAGVHFPERAQAWVPLQLSPEVSKRTDHWLRGVARLEEGVTVERAGEELAALMRGINAENPDTDYGNVVVATPLRDFAARDYRAGALALLGATGLLLLIACADVTGLLLVRASVRGREMALRTLLGASRFRLVRQLATESALLGLAGGALGLLLAVTALPALVALVPVDLPLWMRFTVDGRVLAFAVAASLATSVLFGLAPALAFSRADLAGAIREGGRTQTGGRARLRGALVVGQVAVSLALLAGAGLMLRSFLALRHQPLGFQPESALSLDLSPPGTAYPRGPKARALLDELQRAVEALPGVTSVAFGTSAPLAGGWGRSLTVEGFPELSVKDAPFINHTVITPGYVRTLGQVLVEGREFRAEDWDDPLVTLVDQAVARRYWPDGSALGKRVRYGPPESHEPWHTIVGVVGEVRNQSLEAAGRPNVYIPFSRFFSADMTMVIRSGRELPGLIPEIRAAVTAVDPDIAVSRVASLEQLVENAAWRPRLVAVLFATFAALALLLTGVGLYGLLAYAVSQRTREIGVRMALGASASRVRRGVLAQGARLGAAGLTLGAAGALLAGRVLRSELHGVSPSDPATLAAVVLVLGGVALLATWLPARRATRVDPAVALRDD